MLPGVSGSVLGQRGRLTGDRLAGGRLGVLRGAEVVEGVVGCLVAAAVPVGVGLLLALPLVRTAVALVLRALAVLALGASAFTEVLALAGALTLDLAAPRRFLFLPSVRYLRSDERPQHAGTMR